VDGRIAAIKLTRKMSTQIVAPEHIQRLVEIESRVKYGEPPPRGKESFILVKRNSPVLLSAPHGAKTYRNNDKEVWHEEDEYSAGIALLLGELTYSSVIATNYKNTEYDPNNSDSDKVSYKLAIKDLIKKSSVRFVIDLHGAALHSRSLEENQTVDLGYRSEQEDERSMDEEHIGKLEKLLTSTEDTCDPTCFMVGRNHFAGKGPGTIITFVFRNFGQLGKDRVQAVQIEMKPQMRVAHRFPTASQYISCGPYSADLNCVAHMLQSLAHFINYLEETE
jgi:hypothetical protein